MGTSNVTTLQTTTAHTFSIKENTTHSRDELYMNRQSYFALRHKVVVVVVVVMVQYSPQIEQ